MKQPNILLITTDQQRFDTVGARAPRYLRTPHLDLLAAEGTVFNAAYSDCPICVPARTTIMTGKPALRHGMLRNGRTTSVMGSAETLPTTLASLGYQTAAIGKMHFGPQRARHGFGEMILPDDYYREIHRSGYALQPMKHGLGQLELYPGMSTVPEAMTLTAWTADRCADHIRYRRDPTVPFFLWCSFSKPHPPLDPPEPYYSMYGDAPIPAPIESDWSKPGHAPGVFTRIAERRRIPGIDAVTLRDARAAYHGLITHIDYSIGRLFAALQDSGEWENTLILFTSDHGEFLGDHGNGGKLFFYEPSAHLPFILRPPLRDDSIHVPRETTTPVSLADVYPTLVAAAGGVPDERLDGMDLLGDAFMENRGGSRYVVAAGAYETDCDYVAITDGRWKLIHYPEGALQHLFDLSVDPEERTNLLAAEAGENGSAEAHDRLERELIARLEPFGEPYLHGGALSERVPVTARHDDVRRRGLYSFHTEFFDGDVRH